MKKILLLCSILAITISCKNEAETKTEQETKPVVSETEYLSYTDKEDQFTGGIKMIPIETPKGTQL